uniref:leucine-rich repeat-containing protein 15 isoform X2 n=1 Tax=Scatophagus argus TaxID=75038 RepID=UPI001ED81F90|nr:leucine-rich repeat-containing protein 15 isoform X2 [Scatophagus argus]
MQSSDSHRGRRNLNLQAWPDLFFSAPVMTLPLCPEDWTQALVFCHFEREMQRLTCLMLVILWVVQLVEGCPNACKCSRKSGEGKSEVNCHKRGLRAFPTNLPTDAWILKLGENGITDLKAFALKSVPKIESINLERNAIKSIHPQTFSGATRLMLLNLYGNHITSLPPRGFRDLLNLRFLMLGQNQIGILKPEMFAGMRNLSDLDLPLNALTTLPSNAFKPLIALKVLDLSMNRIQRISPKAFTGLSQLLFLNLDNNSLKTIPVGAFRPLHSLEMLVLDNNLLSTLSLSALDGLGNLQELYLRNNELDHLPPDVFRNMARLSQLALSGNRLKTVDGNMFAHMPDLKKLYLHDNPWQCDCNITSLVQWMGQTKATLSPQGALRCQSPLELRNKSLFSLQANKLLCPA